MFTHATFDFLRDLRENNNKPWFEANRDRWEAHGRAPLAAFIEAMGPRLERVSPHYPVNVSARGGAAFRIHRDVRFSKDKSPYKTHLAAQFRHEAIRGPLPVAVHAPGFYLNVAPHGDGEMSGVFGGFGTWMPEPDALRAIRAAIVESPERWLAARDGMVLSGEALKRPPAGVPADHPCVDDLRLKSFIHVVNFTEADAVAPDFVDRYVEACVRSRPLVGFVCAALGLPF
jgi:uncharacterized protein (TIGR02453 family)